MEGHVLTLDLRHPDEVCRARLPAFASRGGRSTRWSASTKGAVVTAATVADRLQTPRRNPVTAVEATRDKRLLRKRADRCGVLRNPRYVAVDVDAGVDAIDAAIAVTGFPCVVKPVDLAASRGVIRADDRAGVHAAVQRTGALIREICADGSLRPCSSRATSMASRSRSKALYEKGFSRSSPCSTNPIH